VKYFTSAWASGSMEDSEAAVLTARYARDLAAAFNAGDPVRKFAEQIDLNDAYLDRLEYDPANRRLKLLLLTGSLQVGYWHTEITYGGVVAIEGKDALRSALAIRPTEVWYDEFFLDNGERVHGFLLAPREGAPQDAGEFAIRFQTFDCAQSASEGRKLRSDRDESDWGRS
jgi:hypothetical protein